MKAEFEGAKIKMERHTAGDSRISKGIPTREEFDKANDSHRKDVAQLAKRFCDLLETSVLIHDWTKIIEPYATMFYDDMCATIRGERSFYDGEWSKLHYYEKERHHLKRHCPSDVTRLMLWKWFAIAFRLEWHEAEKCTIWTSTKPS